MIRKEMPKELGPAEKKAGHEGLGRGRLTRCGQGCLCVVGLVVMGAGGACGIGAGERGGVGAGDKSGVLSRDTQARDTGVGGL
jgi:hypothetical protein